MDKKDRLKDAYRYLRDRGVVHTQQDVANLMKKTKTNVSSAFNGNEKYLTDKFLMDFNKAFGRVFSDDWLISGDGLMVINGNINQSGDNNSSNNSGTIHNTTNNYRGYGGADKKAAQDILDIGDRITELEGKPIISYSNGKPYYDVDFLGGFDIVLNDQTINPEYLIDFKKYDDADCWCNISGRSMEPLVSNGDIIAIKQLYDWNEFLLYGEVYGIITNDMCTVKIVTKSDKGDDYFRLVPVNKAGEYQPQDLPKKLITHVFRVLGCMKKL